MVNELKELNKSRSCNVSLYLDDNNKRLYKIYKKDVNFPFSIVERNITFLYNNQCIKPCVLEILYDDNGNFIGYSQEYLENSKTFNDGIKDESLTMENRLQYIFDVFSSIKKIHSYGIWIGDVHSKNMLYTSDNGFLVDLDDLRFSEDDNLPLSEYYYVYENFDCFYLKSSQRTDNIKATIAALSVLYKFDFEEICYDRSLSEIMYYLEYFTDDNELLNDIRQIFFNKDEILYFDDVLKKRFGNKIIVKATDN